MVFSASKKIKISKDLFVLLEAASAAAGYSSVDEFIAHVLEREIKNLDEQSNQDDAERQLRGLGYID